MLDFQQKKQFNKVVYSKITFVILLILIFFLARSTYDIYKKYRMSADDYAAVKKDYDGLTVRKEMLTSEINKLNTDSGMEEEIRSKFDVAKPGETVVVVIDSTSSTSTDQNNSKGGFWSNLFGIFNR
jgi:cell division protein FtsB